MDAIERFELGYTHGRCDFGLDLLPEMPDDDYYMLGWKCGQADAHAFCVGYDACAEGRPMIPPHAAEEDVEAWREGYLAAFADTEPVEGAIA